MRPFIKAMTSKLIVVQGLSKQVFIDDKEKLTVMVIVNLKTKLLGAMQTL